MDEHSGVKREGRGEEDGKRKVREQSRGEEDGGEGHGGGAEREGDGRGGERRDEQSAAVKHETSKTQSTLLLYLQQNVASTWLELTR